MKEEMGNIEQFKECLGRMLCYCVHLSLCSPLAGKMKMEQFHSYVCVWEGHW